MRLLIGLAALLFATITSAEEPRTIVFGYECKQVDSDKDGFKCAFDHGELRIHFVVDAAKQSPERREYMRYRYYSTVLRFFDFGGHNVYLTADYWPSGQKELCRRLKEKRFMFICEKAE